MAGCPGGDIEQLAAAGDRKVRRFPALHNYHQPQNTELHPGTSAALRWSILALLIPAASLQPQSGPRPEQNRELPYNQSAANLIEKRFLPLLIASLVFT